MLRRIVVSAALAALTVPVTLSGPAVAADRGDDHPRVDRALAVRSAARGVAQRSAEVSRRNARTASDAPLALTIDQLTPAAIPSQGVIRVSGRVTNKDTVTWSTINLRPFISAEPMTTVAQLEEAEKMPADAVVGERIIDEQHKGFIEELAPGESATYSFTVPRRLLDADGPGVYWFGVHALGEGSQGGDATADGRARTFLPLVPEAREGREPTAVVIPLRHQLLYAEDGSLDDVAGWIQTLSPDGRLRSLVDFGAGAGDQTLNWVVDPALIDAVRRLAAGNPPRSLDANLRSGEADGESDTPDSDTPDSDQAGSASASPGPTDDPSPSQSGETEAPLGEEGTDPDPETAQAAQVAQDWLDRLRAAVRTGDQVLTLPYGDTDIAAAVREDPTLLQRAVARAGSTLTAFDATASPVISSPSGFLDADGLRATDPDTTVLLSDAMFDAPAPAVASIEGHRVVVTSTGAASGGPGPDDPMAVTAMRQRLVSEAAVRFLRHDQAPLVMVLPHDWRPQSSAGFFTGLDLDWLHLTTVAGAASTATEEPVSADDLRYPRWQAEAELGAASFDAAERLTQEGASLQSLLTLNNLVSSTVTDQALGSVSYSARVRPDAARAGVDRSRAWIESKLSSVHISAPPGWAVTLSSSSGRFATTITNELDQPVTVGLMARSDDSLSIEGPRRVDIAAGGELSVLLTARTAESGVHEVSLMVTDKRGDPLGASTRLSVRSAQVSGVIWLILAIGAALLFGAIGVRLFRRVRNAQRQGDSATPDDGEPEPDGAEDPLPEGAASR